MKDKSKLKLKDDPFKLDKREARWTFKKRSANAHADLSAVSADKVRRGVGNSGGVK